MANDSDTIKEAREAFELCEDAESENREQALDDLKFARLGEQWPEGVKKSREEEKRPCLTINRMPAFIRQVVNDARRNKPAIRVHPVDSNADVETAKVLDGLIRNIEASSNADAAYDTAIDFAVSCGIGYFRVDVDYAEDDSFDLDLRINRISNPFSVYRDPRSTAVDSSDWNLAFVTEMLPKDDFEKLYPDVDPGDWDANSKDTENDTWISSDSVRVAEYWTRDEVEKEICLMSNGEVLDADVYEKQREYYEVNGIFPETHRMTKSHRVTQRLLGGSDVLSKKEWAGRYIPIIPVYGEEVVVGEKRHFMSLIHFARDSQVMYNYWRTATAELVALAPKTPWIGPAGAFVTDADKWATANISTHPYIEYDGQVPPQRQAFAGVPAGALQEALNSSDDMKAVMGMFDASLGERSNEVSGRAIMARQREGDISTFHFIDNMTRAIRHAGKCLIDLIPHVYNEARIIRVLGEDEQSQAVQINQPMQVNQQMPINQQMPDEPEPRIYDLTTGRYDIIVKAGPSFTTMREEAATQMMELLRAFPQAAPVIGDIVARNLDWPGAEEISERLKQLIPGGMGQDDQAMAAVQAQLQEAIEQVKTLIRDRQLVEQKNTIDAEKVVVDKYKAETDRMEAMADIEKERLTTGDRPEFQPHSII
jgi:hypothetical protein